jgi:hypothetical protein
VSEWVVWVPVALLALALAALGAAVVRDRSRRSEELAAAYVVLAGLEERLGELERRSDRLAPAAEVASPAPGRALSPDAWPLESPAVTQDEAYLVTRIDEPAQPERATDHRIDGSLFADLVLRESMVKGVSLAYGLGRALSPESRNRIRFLMRQEVKRSRKQRRADLRAARRHVAAVRRAEQAREDAA